MYLGLIILECIQKNTLAINDYTVTAMLVYLLTLYVMNDKL